MKRREKSFKDKNSYILRILRISINSRGHHNSVVNTLCIRHFNFMLYQHFFAQPIVNTYWHIQPSAYRLFTDVRYNLWRQLPQLTHTNQTGLLTHIIEDYLGQGVGRFVFITNSIFRAISPLYIRRHFSKLTRFLYWNGFSQNIPRRARSMTLSLRRILQITTIPCRLKPQYVSSTHTYGMSSFDSSI